MKVAFVSLGCAKNLVDSEQMLSLVTAAGHEITPDPAEAEAVVVNTCAFIDAASQESIDTILELAKLKKTGTLKRLVVTGCLPERYRGEILEELPEIDAVLGTGSFPDIVTALESPQGRFSRFRDKNEPLPELARAVTTGPAWAYLKIADGCDHRCAYCVIPSIRGRYRSRPLEAVVAEAKNLAAAGVKEMILVAQDVTRYGVDLRDGTTLTGLLRALVQVDGVQWLRLHYLYPHEVTDELIDFVASEPKAVDYFDIPIQHINTTILHRMRRPETSESIRALFRKIRERVPDAVLRTSLIVGLPGEGEREFGELLAFLREMQLPRAGVFAYSPQEGTDAAGMADRCSAEEAEARRQRVMDLQSEIMDAYDRSRLGKVLPILCEGEEDGAWTGRTYADSPDVDETVLFTGHATPGEFVSVCIDDAVDGRLIGHTV